MFNNVYGVEASVKNIHQVGAKVGHVYCTIIVEKVQYKNYLSLFIMLSRVGTLSNNPSLEQQRTRRRLQNSSVSD
jgi:hypothetical protein